VQTHDFKPVFTDQLPDFFGVLLGYVTRVFVEGKGRDLQPGVSVLSYVTAGVLK
jgi:hypothetical protein